MRVKGNLSKILFGLNLLLYLFSMFSPWASKTRPSIMELPGRPPFIPSGEELYWSFQVVLYPYRNGYENRLVSWDFWFGPHDRVLLQDFWFSRDMYYYGFTYEWIRIFALQTLTVASSILALLWRWPGTIFMLASMIFSILSASIGLLLIGRFMFVWQGYANPSWGLPAALLSTSGFVVLFLLKCASERRRRKAVDYLC